MGSNRKIEKSEEQWKAELTPEQYRVCRQKGTECAFTGEHYASKEEGVYKCTCCQAELFTSDTKFDSASGWPSFYAPVHRDSVEMIDDLSHGMRRTEVICSSCGAHLGHVFPDGPEPTGQRFCINSVALKIDKK